MSITYTRIEGADFEKLIDELKGSPHCDIDLIPTVSAQLARFKATTTHDADSKDRLKRLIQETEKKLNVATLAQEELTELSKFTCAFVTHIPIGELEKIKIARLQHYLTANQDLPGAKRVVVLSPTEIKHLSSQ